MELDMQRKKGGKHSVGDSIGGTFQFLERISKFQTAFFKEHPECKNCEHMGLADETVYADVKKLNCQSCSLYKGW